ncbi:MAG: efflux RND transporter permease subunit [Candidatus Uhrbacteria bacterium]|nr:efflux RND transporter permease subunit [Candidatus Uhrbacteria bacterium]
MNIFFNAIIQWSMRHKGIVMFLAVAIVGGGLWSLQTMKVDILPDVNKPTVTVFAEADGLASEEIEKLIVNPLELAVAGAPGVDKVRSSSIFSLGLVNIEFEWGTDIYRNRQIVQERITQVNLPEGVKPVLGPTSSVMGEIMWVGLTSKNGPVDSMKIRTLADWTVLPALLRIPGISNVLIMGGDVKQWQISVDAEKLKRYGLRLDDVAMNLKGVMKNRGGDVLYQNDSEYPIRIIVLPTSAQEIESIAIGRVDGKVVRLGDVGRAQERPSVVRGTATVDGTEGVVIRIVRLPDAETLTVTKEIDRTLAELQKSFPEGIEFKNDLLRQEWFIHAGLGNVIEALRDGTIILILILLLFLMNFRITFITLTAIPLSIFVAIIVFKMFGLSVNVMTLGGLAVAIGELVDDAIVGVENVYRRLREHSLHSTGESTDSVIGKASSEVRNSIVYATALVAIAFLPIFMIPGVEGKLLSPLGAAYIVSLIASMIVSLTVTPVLCSYFLRGKAIRGHEKDTWLVYTIKKTLRPMLSWSIDRPKILIGAVLISLVVSGVIYAQTGKEGIPPFNEGSATVMIILPVGTNLKTTNDFVTRIEKDVMKIKGVLRVSHTSGRSAVDSHGGGSNSSEMQVVFEPGLEEKKTELFREIQTVLDRYPGQDYSLGQPITHRLEQLLSGVRAPIVIKVFGDDQKDLRDVAEMIQGELSRQEGIKNARIEKDVTVPEVRIYPLPNRLAEYGVSPGMVADEIEDGLMGMYLDAVPYRNERIPVLLRYDLKSRGNVQAISDLPLPFDGVESLSGSAAEVRLEAGRNKISHEDSRRVLVVSANYEGRNIVGAVENVKKKMDVKKIPTGTLISYEGTYKSQKENSQRLALLFLVGLVLIFLVLYSAFRSSWIVAQIMLNIPTVFIGSLLAIYLTENTISLAHMIGFISLTGIVSRNGIMLIARCIGLIQKEGEPFSKETVIRATLDRVTPVLMTSLVTAFALVPLLMSGDKPGKELLYPLAVVIFGGLISSTFISIFLTPTIFFRFGKKSLEKLQDSPTGF